MQRSLDSINWENVTIPTSSVTVLADGFRDHVGNYTFLYSHPTNTANNLLATKSLDGSKFKEWVFIGSGSGFQNSPTSVVRKYSVVWDDSFAFSGRLGLIMRGSQVESMSPVNTLVDSGLDCIIKKQHSRDMIISARPATGVADIWATSVDSKGIAGDWTVNSIGAAGASPLVVVSDSFTIEAGNSTFVCADQHGAIGYSSDTNGAIWTLTHSFDNTNGVPQVVYQNGKFYVFEISAAAIAVDSNHVAISDDGGVTWRDFFEFVSTPTNVTAGRPSSGRITSTQSGTAFALTGITDDQNIIQWDGPFLVGDYKRFSVFAPKLASSVINITENPVAILDDVFSRHLSIVYRQDQSSDVQVDVSSFKFNAYFAERQTIEDITQEFMQTVGAYAWIGDSGMINYRSYQESATMTNSIDRTVSAEDMLKFSLDESPIGSPVVSSRLTSKYQFQYDFNFQQDRYTKALPLNQANNTMCSSLFDGGIKQETEFRSRYIMDADVASAWAVNISRTQTLGSLLMDITLPGKFLEFELADVIKVQHPMLTGSETLAQIVDMRTDYRRGKIQIKAEELKTYAE